MANHPPIQLAASFPTSRLGVAVSALGGRCFDVRHTGSPADGDVIIAAPDAAGSRSVLVPRGLGKPLLARAASPTSGFSSSLSGTAGWQAEATGEACSPRRWVAVGGLAARIRFVPLPRGPAPAVRPGNRFSAATGPLLAFRVVSPLWAAACRVDASLAQGPVAVVDQFVRAVSPDAVAAGVATGMSLRLARRRCPHLRLVPVVTGVDVVGDLAALLDGELGAVSRSGSTLLVRLPDAPVGELLGLAERLIVRVWQALGIRVRAAIAADAQCAAELTRILDPEMLAYIPGTASAVWRRGAALRASAKRRAAVRTAIPDIEGIVTQAKSMLAGIRGPGELRLQTEHGVERVFVLPGHVPSIAVEDALRKRGVRLGGVFSMRWHPKSSATFIVQSGTVSKAGNAHAGGLGQSGAPNVAQLRMVQARAVPSRDAQVSLLPGVRASGG